MTIEFAIEIALKYHAGQKDKSGLPYILHPLTVATMVKTETEKIVAILHDIIEDTDVTEEFLRNYFTDEVVDAVVALTRRENESYRNFIHRVSENKIASIVKMKDMEHNMDLSRLGAITATDIMRRDKYLKWSKFLATVYISKYT